MYVIRNRKTGLYLSNIGFSFAPLTAGPRVYRGSIDARAAVLAMREADNPVAEDLEVREASIIVGKIEGAE